MRILFALLASVFGAINNPGQRILFDFDAAPVHSSLPVSLSVGGVTAQLSGPAQSFSIQPADTLGFSPAGFAGNCIYPNSVFAADLHIAFSVNITDFSILYAPEEYACDSSATMRVTAYSNGVAVATATTNAGAGTWPSETLQISRSSGFDSVLVHYDAPPITGGDWGPIFMADNMQVTPSNLPVVLSSPVLLPNGGVQFTFTNLPNRTFTIYSASDVASSSANWVAAGSAVEVTPGSYQFTEGGVLSASVRFYQAKLN